MPAPVLTVERLSPVASLLRVTWALGTTAPDGSVTTPDSSPVPPCAHILQVNSRHSASISRKQVKALRNRCSITLSYNGLKYAQQGERTNTLPRTPDSLVSKQVPFQNRLK